MGDGDEYCRSRFDGQYIPRTPGSFACSSWTANICSSAEFESVCSDESRRRCPLDTELSSNESVEGTATNVNDIDAENNHDRSTDNDRRTTDSCNGLDAVTASECRIGKQHDLY